MAPTRICLINQKGGCGKSSTTYHLGGHLARSGQRVLLVDTDPQGSLSQGFFGSQTIESLPAEHTLAALFRGDVSPVRDSLATATHVEGLSIVRANQLLAPHNSPSPESQGLLQFALASYLERSADCDVVLMDCPPNLYLCSWNALLAADFVIVPVPPEDFGTQGLRAVHQAIEQAAALNPQLTLLGHLITRSDRRLLVHRAYEEKLREFYGDQVLETVIPEASAFKVALACRQPVADYAPRSRAAAVMIQLAEELVQRQRALQQNVAVA